jgi:DNA gyrase subunit A
VKTAKVTAKTGNVVAARAVTADTKEVLFGSANGQVIRIPVSSVSQLSRATQGVRLMRVDTGDKLATVTPL